MKQPKQCDYLVIGAGSGGLLAAVGLQQLGKDVLVVSKDIGGDCTHYGCVPSKNFLQLASDYTRESDESAKAELKRTALQNVQALVHAFSEEESTLIASDRYLNGVAQFRDVRTIEVTYADSSTDLVAFRKKCIIASGSSPVRMKIVGVPAERLITNEEFFYLSELPKSITIIGGGPIGAELATACARFGLETYLLSREYLSREPREVASRSLTALQKSGVQYVAARADRLADKKLFLEDGTTIPETEYYLVAVGRRPNTELNLEAASIEYSEKGIAIDTNLLTTNRNIFAIGDCTESPQFTHLAAHHAKFVLKKLLVPFVKKRIRALPRVTFTAPPIASVGELTETKHHKQFVLNFTKLDRAVLSADTKSYGVVLVDLRTGKIKGASLYGAFSENLITVFTLIIDAEIALLQLSDFITPYPTYGNIFHALTVEYLRYISKNWKRYPLGSLYQMVRYVLG